MYIAEENPLTENQPNNNQSLLSPLTWMPWSQVGPKLFPPPYLAGLRDILRLYSTLIIGFRSQLNRRSKTGFSRDYTFQRMARTRFLSWIGEIYIGALAIRRSSLRFLAGRRSISETMTESSNWKTRVDIRSLRHWEEQLPRQMLVHLLRPRKVYREVQCVSSHRELSRWVNSVFL